MLTLMRLRCAGLTPLILASAAGHVDVCEVLLQNKCDIDNVSDKNKDTALSLACSNGRLEVNKIFHLHISQFHFCAFVVAVYQLHYVPALAAFKWLI